VDVADQLLGSRLEVGGLLGALCGAGEGGFVVETVEIAACFLEFLDPFLRL
jgi:hypothetical protein